MLIYQRLEVRNKFKYFLKIFYCIFFPELNKGYYTAYTITEVVVFSMCSFFDVWIMAFLSFKKCAQLQLKWILLCCPLFLKKCYTGVISFYRKCLFKHDLLLAKQYTEFWKFESKCIFQYSTCCTLLTKKTVVIRYLHISIIVPTILITGGGGGGHFTQYVLLGQFWPIDIFLVEVQSCEWKHQEMHST